MCVEGNILLCSGFFAEVSSPAKDVRKEATDAPKCAARWSVMSNRDGKVVEDEHVAAAVEQCSDCRCLKLMDDDDERRQMMSTMDCLEGRTTLRYLVGVVGERERNFQNSGG